MKAMYSERLILFFAVIWMVLALAPALGADDVVKRFSHAGFYPYLENRWFLDMKDYSESAHGKIPCEICHKSISSDEKKHPEQNSKEFLAKSSIERFDYAQCGKCHPYQDLATKKGVHAELPLRKKDPNSLLAKLPEPKCGHCHDSHYDKAIRERFALGVRSVNRCGLCHLAQMESYLKDIHGKKAYYLKDRKAPFCTDCHGGHEVISLKETQVQTKTCERCHPTAGRDLVKAVIHKLPEKELTTSHPKKAELKIIRVVGTIAATVVGVIIVFSAMHTGLFLLREIQKRLKRARP